MIYAISDLHISRSGEKPMDVFGASWKNHYNRICENWSKTVSEEDTVLVPGDLSWAMRINEAFTDLSEIMQLPGKKIFIRGNHDYWWSGIGKVRDKFSCFENAYFLQNDSVTVDGISYCGTRGWLCPQNTEYKKTKDESIYRREVSRLEMALKKTEAGLPKVVLLHFPPLVDSSNEFTDLLEKYNVNNVVYGHLHGIAIQNAFVGERNGISYTLCSADSIGFCPIKVDIG